MPAPFETYRQRAVQQVDRIHAEAVRFEPRRSGNYGSGSDSTRPALNLAGPLRIGSGENDSGGARRNFSSTIAAGKAELYLDRDRLPAGFAPQRGDWIIPLDRPHLGRFEVDRVDGGAVGRLVIILTATGVA